MFSATKFVVAGAIVALFGGIVTVSGPTVIMPLLRTIRPTRRR